MPDLLAAPCSDVQHAGQDQDLPRDCVCCPVRLKGFCSALGRAGIVRISTSATKLRLRANDVIGRAGAFPASENIILSGYVRTVHYSLNGARQVVGLNTPGDFISPRPGTNDDVIIEAATAVQLCRFDHHRFQRMVGDNHLLRLQVYRSERSSAERTRRFAWLLGGFRPEDRLRLFLAGARDCMPWQPLPTGGGILTMELPRSDIADLLGTTFETISRVTHRLHRSGLIRIRDPRHFEIPDPDRLAHVGHDDRLEASPAEELTPPIAA